MAYYGDNGYDYHRRGRSPRYEDPRRTSGGYLNVGGGAPLQRSRSHGHAPVPVVNIYNDQVQDAYQRSESTYPYPPPPPMAPPIGAYPVYAAPPPAPTVIYQTERRSRSRGRDRLGEEVVEDLVEMSLDDVHRRNRSRSRGRSDANYYQPPDWYEWQIRKKEEEAEKERKRVIEEYEAKKRKDAEFAKAEEIRIREKYEREKKEAKEKEEREYKEFLAKQKEKEEEEKAKKKAEKEKFETEMRRRLQGFGYTERQIDIMVDEEKAKKLKEEGKTTTITSTDIVWRGGGRNPVYPKIHRDYLEIKTLEYYRLPWEYDRSDPNYIIILQDMDKYQTEVLFEHTKRLRSKLLIEAPAKPDKQYAFYRKRGRSHSRGDRVGILEVKKVL